MKTLIIIRGAPGAGKSTLAKALAFANCEGPTHIAEADKFFTDGEGKYHYIPHLVPAAHEHCKRSVRHVMEHGVPTVIVSNTTTTKERLQPYLDLAKEFDYVVQQIVSFGTFSNLHNVPADAVKKMRDQLRNSLINELKSGELL